MPDFPLARGAYRYRPLRLTEPELEGWDCFALQTGLKGLSYPLKLDGVLGEKTALEIGSYQADRGLDDDGVAGILTQRRIALDIAREIQERFELPRRLLKGQIEHESSYVLGNHTTPYTDGERDCGVVQRNTNFASVEQAFDTVDSIAALGARISQKHDEYRPRVSERRAWELAAGSWNAPAWTDTLARGGTLSAAQRAHIEAYIDAVTAYVRF